MDEESARAPGRAESSTSLPPRRHKASHAHPMADVWVEAPPEAELPGAIPGSSHPIDSSSISVLLVRKPSGSEEVAELLKSEAYVVTEADTDSKALELLKSTRVDLILTDHEPPAWDCCKFIRSVLENPKTQLVPIVGAFGCLRAGSQATARPRPERHPPARPQSCRRRATSTSWPRCCTSGLLISSSSLSDETSCGRSGPTCGGDGCARAPAGCGLRARRRTPVRRLSLLPPVFAGGDAAVARGPGPGLVAKRPRRPRPAIPRLRRLGRERREGRQQRSERSRPGARVPRGAGAQRRQQSAGRLSAAGAQPPRPRQLAWGPPNCLVLRRPLYARVGVAAASLHDASLPSCPRRAGRPGTTRARSSPCLLT